jgi:hypothetical protein
MEKIRQALINWNVAPLMVVSFLCYVTYLLVMNLIGMTCSQDPAVYLALSGLITAMAGILWKVYNSMQRDRKQDEDE